MQHEDGREVTLLQKQLIETVLEGMAGKHMNQSDLAVKAGMQKSQVSRLLSGKIPGSFDTWQLLITALDKDIRIKLVRRTNT
jgi:predicted XRE-type DNA-binding protein